MRRVWQRFPTELIKELGGVAEVAKVCGITRPSVCGWRYSDVPRAHKNFLRLKFPALKCWRLDPKSSNPAK